MGNFINNLLDNLISTTWRMMELPFNLLFIFMVIALILFNWLGRRWLKELSNQKRLYINAALILMLLLYVADKKFSFIRTEMNVLNENVRNVRMKIRAVAFHAPVDLSKFNKEFPKAKLFKRSINEAVQLLTVIQQQPNSVVYIGRVDLTHPKIKIEISPQKREKYLTSTFAKKHGAVLAINGEAGETPAPNCELGKWSGNWVRNGNPVMMVDTKLRPFIGFNKHNVAKYYEEEFVDTEYKDDYYNAIWGRFDILKKNKTIFPRQYRRDFPYARTVMGLDQDGSELFLMVVDGKRPWYSVGLTYEDCAKMLRSLGAYDAMACDQGGSSCMYVEDMGGIINRPADWDGIERPVYSHFGISFR